MQRLGKWTLEAEVGRGGMGRVYRAREDGTDRTAAVKVLPAELAQEPGFAQRFQREIEALSQLEHPNIVRFYESGAQDGMAYYAMEYVEGPTFDDLLQERGRIPWEEVLDAALQICPALKHAHDRGIIHRDLKPPNLLRTPEGIVKLTDFGIAKIFANHHLTATGGVVGTAEFLSPEQAAGKPVSKRSDLYSLGVVLYTLLTGRPPFEGESMVDVMHKHRYAQFDPPQRIVPDLPYEINDVVCHLMEKDPAKRPPDAMVLHRTLDGIRRKLERKAQQTQGGGRGVETQLDYPVCDVDQPSQLGPANLESRVVREELDRDKHGGPVARLVNNAWFLVPAFLLVVGTLLWTFWPRSTPPAEQLFLRGSELMASAEPRDWTQAWTEYLEPLNRAYPNHPYQKEVEEYRARIEDQAAQRLALAKLRIATPPSAAQRFYQRGIDLAGRGDVEAARQVWQNTVKAFAGVESEQRWVRLAEAGLAELHRRELPDSAHDIAVRAALQRARQLRQEGKTREADQVLDGLEALYTGDPLGADVLAEIRRQRQPAP